MLAGRGVGVAAVRGPAQWAWRLGEEVCACLYVVRKKAECRGGGGGGKGANAYAFGSLQASDFGVQGPIENTAHRPATLRSPRRQKELEAKYPEGTPVPKPPHWGGFLLRPLAIEFWQVRPRDMSAPP